MDGTQHLLIGKAFLLPSTTGVEVELTTESVECEPDVHFRANYCRAAGSTGGATGGTGGATGGTGGATGGTGGATGGTGGATGDTGGGRTGRPSEPFWGFGER